MLTDIGKIQRWLLVPGMLALGLSLVHCAPSPDEYTHVQKPLISANNWACKKQTLYQGADEPKFAFNGTAVAIRKSNGNVDALYAIDNNPNNNVNGTVTDELRHIAFVPGSPGAPGTTNTIVIPHYSAGPQRPTIGGFGPSDLVAAWSENVDYIMFSHYKATSNQWLSTPVFIENTSGGISDVFGAAIHTIYQNKDNSSPDVLVSWTNFDGTQNRINYKVLHYNSATHTFTPGTTKNMGPGEDSGLGGKGNYVAMVWDLGGGGEIKISISEDAGSTWSSVHTVATTGQDPSVCVDSTYIYIAYHLVNGGGIELKRIGRFATNGVPPQPTTRLFSIGPVSRFARVVCGNGDVVVKWEAEPNSSNYYIGLAKSSDSGSTFTQGTYPHPQPFGNTTDIPTIATSGSSVSLLYRVKSGANYKLVHHEGHLTNTYQCPGQ